jgi:4-alpha-glucanotransferase
VIRQSGYLWWIRRIEHSLRLHDLVRIDHFRGLCAYWEVPAGEKTAIVGKWVDGPGEDIFHALLRRRPYLPLVAEDLGVITPDVRELMRRFDLPGMKILLFAFSDDLARNPYVPHNHVQNCIVYTGTHDNNTARGWFEAEAGPEVKGRLFAYLGRELTPEQVPWEMIRLAMTSVADLSIAPAQDVLGLGPEARMNRPSVAFGNWEWRLPSAQFPDPVKSRLLKMTEIYGRA